MARQGIYNTLGELFGILDGEYIYSLEGELMGEVRGEKKGRAAYSLDGERMWYVSGDGLYSLKWEPVGYLGSPFAGTEEDDY